MPTADIAQLRETVTDDKKILTNAHGNPKQQCQQRAHETVLSNSPTVR